MSKTLNDANRYIAYICPVCSETSTKKVNIFEFSAPYPVEFCCKNSSCGESCVTISRSKDKFKVVIDCPICGETHSFKASSSSFILKDLLTFACPESNFNIFFCGKKNEVKKAVSQNQKQFDNMAEAFGDFTEDLNIMYRIIDRLHFLIDNDKIRCSCGSFDIIPDLQNGSIVLTCYECGKSIVIEPNTKTLEILEKSDGFEF